LLEALNVEGGAMQCGMKKNKKKGFEKPRSKHRKKGFSCNMRTGGPGTEKEEKARLGDYSRNHGEN